MEWFDFTLQIVNPLDPRHKAEDDESAKNDHPAQLASPARKWQGKWWTDNRTKLKAMGKADLAVDIT